MSEQENAWEWDDGENGPARDFDFGPEEGSGDSAYAAARAVLGAWQASQPDNFYSADSAFQRTLEYFAGPARFAGYAAQCYRFGAVAATAVDAAVRISNEPENLPRLSRHDAHGRRLETVNYHPAYHEAGRHIYASGVMSALAEPGQNLLSLALFYLSAQNGEAGHNCPLACTAGVIKALQAAGSAELKARYLPRLLDPDYDTRFHGAQYVTEIQGGSDVGANATVATPRDPAVDGSWLLNGEKWFCSNVTADLALVSARVPGQGDGTDGLGLFLVPRRLDDGGPNGLYIQRLKDKIGTRSLATAEVVFRDALAYQVGEVDKGIHLLLQHVINTSRVFNAVGAAGNARRAYVTAWTYAQHRHAFGRPIARFPLVQDTLAQMRADVTAMLSGTFYLIHRLDAKEAGRGDAYDGGFLRMAINLNKYRTAVLARDVILQAIELLGGNGAIESFSILPRLLRDNVVYENWEGTHNVLMAQVQRDVRRFGVHEAFFARARELLAASLPSPLREECEKQLGIIEAELASLLALDPLSASIYFRPLMTRLADLYYAASLLAESAWESAPQSSDKRSRKSRHKRRAARFYFDRRVAGRQAREIEAYDELMGHLCAGL